MLKKCGKMVLHCWICFLYHEITMKKRRVYMDYRINPTGYENEQTPAQRLQAASPFAYQTLLEKGFTDDTMIVEVHPAIAQHNGGLSVNYFWESNLSHLFPIGEAAGTHGSFTPMGASINASQGLRVPGGSVYC